MCIFSGPVKDVSDTKIFAGISGSKQYLAYEMSFLADEKLAMLLPIPTPPRISEQAVSFISLEKYTGFFSDLSSLFPVPLTRGIAPSLGLLRVEKVGAFEASFVPSASDFHRLDPRFKIPSQALSAWPEYNDFGFAVFKLGPGKQRVHAMAFSFPTRYRTQIYFPTRHVHDGTVRETAYFDHSLYFQLGRFRRTLPVSEQSNRRVGWIQARRSSGILSPNRRCYRISLHGFRANADVYVPHQLVWSTPSADGTK